MKVLHFDLTLLLALRTLKKRMEMHDSKENQKKNGVCTYLIC